MKLAEGEQDQEHQGIEFYISWSRDEYIPKDSGLHKVKINL